MGTLLHSCRTGPVGKLLFKKLILLMDEKEYEEVCRNCSQDWLGKQIKRAATCRGTTKFYVQSL